MSERYFCIFGRLALGMSFLPLAYTAFSHFWTPGPTVFDDAFMFSRYAYNVAEHGNYGWNAGEATFGCTSVLYTFWVWFWQELIGIGIAHTKFILAGSSLFFGLLGLFLLWRSLRLLHPAGVPAWMWLLPVVGSNLFVTNSTNGMDSSMAFAATTAMVWAWLRYRDQPHTKAWLLAILLSYLPFLVRPDTGFYVTLFPALWLWSQGKRHRIFPSYLILGALLIADTAIKWWYFGDPLPLPYYGKSGDILIGYIGQDQWRISRYLVLLLLTGAAPAIVVVLRNIRPAWQTLVAMGLPMFLTLFVLHGSVQVMGYDARLYFASLPFLLLAPLAALDQEQLHSLYDHGLRTFLFAYVALLGLWIVTQRIDDYRNFIEEREANEILYGQPDWDPHSGAPIFRIVNQLSPHDTIAASEHGFLSVLYPDMYILDLVGLHHPDIAKFGYQDSLLDHYQPALIWMPHEDYTGLRDKMLNNPGFQAHYHHFEDIKPHGIALRRDHLAFDRIVRYLKEQEGKK